MFFFLVVNHSLKKWGRVWRNIGRKYSLFIPTVRSVFLYSIFIRNNHFVVNFPLIHLRIPFTYVSGSSIYILLYLNDVVKRGETSFPMADDVNRLNSRNYSVTLNEKCQQANLLIKPKKGTAIMWYNHLLEHDGSTHIGDIDWLSLHCGSDVMEGVKWIANVSLNAPFKNRIT